MTDDACYRAMDGCRRSRTSSKKKISTRSQALNLEVDLLFFDTTSTYFEVDEEDEPVARDKHGSLTEDEQQAAEGSPAGSAPTASPRTTAMTCRRW